MPRVRKNVATAKDKKLAVATDAIDALNGVEQFGYIERNRVAWERWAAGYVVSGRTAWLDDELRWGVWGLPESQLRLLEDVDPHADVVELGCGTAAIPAWLARRGIHAVGVDVARAQVQAAERFQREFDLSFPLICGNAEQVPFEDSSFDMAISEYGASLWCNPRRWLPEAHRLLRLGGTLIFVTNSALLMACTPADGSAASDRLVQDYFSRYRLEFQGDGSVEFHLTHGHWIRLLRATGFVLDNLIEVRPPPDAKPRFDFASLAWARRWPSEEIWIATKVQ